MKVYKRRTLNYGDVPLCGYSTTNLKQATSVLVGWWFLLSEGGTDD